MGPVPVSLYDWKPLWSKWTPSSSKLTVLKPYNQGNAGNMYRGKGENSWAWRSSQNMFGLKKLILTLEAFYPCHFNSGDFIFVRMKKEKWVKWEKKICKTKQKSHGCVLKVEVCVPYEDRIILLKQNRYNWNWVPASLCVLLKTGVLWHRTAKNTICIYISIYVPTGQSVIYLSIYL